MNAEPAVGPHEAADDILLLVMLLVLPKTLMGEHACANIACRARARFSSMRLAESKRAPEGRSCSSSSKVVEKLWKS